MSEHGGDTSDQTEKPTPEEAGGEGSGPAAGVPPGDDATGVYGTSRGSGGATAAWYGATSEPAAGREREGSEQEGPATAAYGTADAAAPQWSPPGAPSPQPTAVQPLPGQQAAPQQGVPQWSPTGTAPASPPTQAFPQVQPTAPGYGAPQPAPTMAAQQVAAAPGPAGYFPAGPAPSGGRHWNMWAGIPAAAAVYALGYLWALIKVNTSTFDFPFRQQVAIGLQAAAVVIGLLTLVALATKKRALAAPLALLLGGVLLAEVGYGWYLQMDTMYSRFDFTFVFERLLPITFPLVVLALVTIVAALLMRIDGQRR